MKRKRRTNGQQLVQLALCVPPECAERYRRAAEEHGRPLSAHLREHLAELEAMQSKELNEVAKDAAELEAQIDADRFYRAAQLRELAEHADAISLLADVAQDRPGSALTGCYHLSTALAARLRGISETGS